MQNKNLLKEIRAIKLQSMASLTAPWTLTTCVNHFSYSNSKITPTRSEPGHLPPHIIHQNLHKNLLFALVGPNLEILLDFIEKMMLEAEKNLQTWINSQT